MLPKIKQWVEKEFKTLELQSSRLLRRFFVTMSTLSDQPDKSVLTASGGRGQAKAVYRMLANGKYTDDAVMSAHHDAIQTRYDEIRAERGEVELLAVQDTMSVNYEGHKKTTDLGYTGNDTRGLSVHSCMLIDDVGVPLGVLAQDAYSRSEPKAKGTHFEKRSRPIEEKESYRWLKTMEDAAKAAPRGAKIIHVADREGDIYELYALATRTDQSFVIRAIHDRNDNTNEHIITKLYGSEAIAQITVTVPENHAMKQKERKASLSVRYGEFHIKRPQTVSKGTAPEFLSVNLVSVREETPPEGIEPIEWLLMTNLAIRNVDDVIHVVDIYRKRWKIERFHYLLKSGCGIEQLQQRTVEGLTSMLLLYSIIAIQIMALAFLARTAPDSPASLLFDESEIVILWKAANQTKSLPTEIITIAKAAKLVAKLGGFAGAPSDGHPGLKVIWQGLSKLYTLCTYAAFLT